MRRSVGISLFDQALLSLFNLGLNLVMIRHAAPAEFGRFIFAAAVILGFTSLQNALVATPLSALVPGRSADEQARTASDIVSADLVFRACAAILAPAMCCLTSVNPAFLLAVAAAAVTTLGRETARSVVLAHERTILCLRIDMIAVATSAVAIAALWTIAAPEVAALTGIAVGNALATLTGASQYAPFRRSPWEAFATYRVRYWPDTQWSLVGAATTEVQYRSYVFALELFRDAAVLASVQAGRLLLGPLPLVVGAWARVARPAMARHLSAGNNPAVVRLTAQGLVYVLVVAACYCLALFIIWPFASEQFFHGKYPDVGMMTLAWACYMVVVVAHMVLSVPLQAAMRMKELAKVTIATAVLTCLLLCYLATGVHAIFAVVAATAAEVVALLWIFVLVARMSREIVPEAAVRTAGEMVP